MIVEEWTAMNTQQRIALRSLHARALAVIMESLYDCFPVRMNTFLADEVQKLITSGQETDARYAKEAIWTCIELLHDHGLLKYDVNSPEKEGMWRSLVLTPSGYLFIKKYVADKERNASYFVRALSGDYMDSIEEFNSLMKALCNEFGTLKLKL